MQYLKFNPHSHKKACPRHARRAGIQEKLLLRITQVKTMPAKEMEACSVLFGEICLNLAEIQESREAAVMLETSLFV